MHINVAGLVAVQDCRAVRQEPQGAVVSELLVKDLLLDLDDHGGTGVAAPAVFAEGVEQWSQG